MKTIRLNSKTLACKNREGFDFLNCEAQNCLIKISRKLLAVFANILNGTTFHCLFAKAFFLSRLRLLENKRMPTVVVPLEVCGGGFAAKIAVDALVIHVKLSLDILLVTVGCVGHGGNYY
jgi:hypothetical protein